VPLVVFADANDRAPPDPLVRRRLFLEHARGEFQTVTLMETVRRRGARRARRAVCVKHQRGENVVAVRVIGECLVVAFLASPTSPRSA